MQTGIDNFDHSGNPKAASNDRTDGRPDILRRTTTRITFEFAQFLRYGHGLAGRLVTLQLRSPRFAKGGFKGSTDDVAVIFHRKGQQIVVLQTSGSAFFTDEVRGTPKEGSGPNEKETRKEPGFFFGTMTGLVTVRRVLFFFRLFVPTANGAVGSRVERSHVDIEFVTVAGWGSVVAFHDLFGSRLGQVGFYQRWLWQCSSSRSSSSSSRTFSCHFDAFIVVVLFSVPRSRSQRGWRGALIVGAVAAVRHSYFL